MEKKVDRKVARLIQIAVIGAVCILFALLVAVIVQVIIKSSLESREAMLKEQIAKTEKNIENLEDEIEYRKSSDYIEKYIREKLGYIKDGETKFS